MNKFLCLITILLITGCSGEKVEEFVFRETMEYQLKNKCEEENKECFKAIEEQIDRCMKISDWQKYLDNDEDQEEMQRFIYKFFPCFKDPNGNSYFPLD
jgi:predicted ribosome quality control (RQC) complex YloA/Tae2 family protein